MKVAELLQRRRQNWRELERLCQQMEQRRKRTVTPAAVNRFALLYRCVCADLALADAYQLPPSTVHYLHHLVGRAHNQLYRSRTFRYSTWLHELLYAVPQRLFNDNSLRLAFAIFWGGFLASMYLAYISPAFAEELIGKEQLVQMEEMHADSIGSGNPSSGGFMAGFYIYHNAGIGLQCFAYGLLFGVGGLVITISNAVMLGAIFGHMIHTPQRDNFFQFVTAHGPFELTAIVVAAAAGMRLGFSLIDTGGLARTAAMRRAAVEAMPTMCASIVMFGLAALIEGFISPSTAPYWSKCLVAIASSGIMVIYFVLLGYPRAQADGS